MTNYWRGRPLNQLSNDELIEVIEYLAEQNADLLAPQNIRAYALGRVEMIKRGEPWGLEP